MGVCVFTTGYLKLEDVAPPIAQTGYGRVLKFGMDSGIKDRTAVTRAIFEFPLLGRAKGKKQFSLLSGKIMRPEVEI